jgi:RNA polymerase sigma factor (sigma-70 family)
MNEELRMDMARCCLPGTREKNDELYPAVMAGSAEAREQMIHANMPLVIAKVKIFLVQRPEMRYLRDDLTAAGFVGLTQAVNAMQGHTDSERLENPTGYLLVAIQNELNHLVDEETTVSIPWQTQSRGRRVGEELRRPEPSHDLSEEVVRTTPDHTQLIELRDLIDACCDNPFDRQIVALKAEGHTQRETAALLGVNPASISLALKTIYARVQERMAE